jgi:hypothetical protein
MFQKIESDKLVYNQPYRIGEFCKGTYKGRIHINELNGYYLEFDFVHYNGIIHNHICFLPTDAFYEFVSQKDRIQWEMELRSVNLFLRKLIGDNAFTW